MRFWHSSLVCAACGRKETFAHRQKTGEVQTVRASTVCFLGYKKVFSDDSERERSERVLVAAAESEEVGAARKARPEQKSDPAAEASVRFSQPRDLVVDLFARKFLAAVACFKVPCRRVTSRYEVDLECLRMAKKAVLGKFAKTVFDIETRVELSGEAAMAAVKVSCQVPEVRAGDPL